MKDIHGLGALGISPFMSDDVLKQIRSRAGKIAYSLVVSDQPKRKPVIKEGVHEARGALKWIFEELEGKNEK